MGGMRRVILYIACSADGYIARPDGAVDWLEAYSAGGEDYGYAAFLARVDTVILGRTTWDFAVSLADDPYPEQHSYVYTHRPPAPRERVTFVAGPPAELVGRLRAQAGRDIWLVGGAALNTAFAQADLIDETWLFVVPTLLGAGIPLYRPGAPEQTLRLLDTHAYATGLVRLRYAHHGATGPSPTSGA
jgi:dihydrofolate reductase